MQPVQKLTVRGMLHSFWLANGNDALYMASGAIGVARVPGGAASRDIGREADVSGEFKISRYTEFSMQYGHLFAGPFLRQYGGPGGRDFYAAWIDLRL